MSMQAEAISERGLLARIYMKNRLLLGMAALHYVIAFMLSRWLGVAFTPSALPVLLTFLKTLIPTYLIVCFLWRFGQMSLYIRPEKPIGWFLRDLRGFVLDPDRMLNGIAGILLISIFANTFTIVKDLIPLMMPFTWDPLFASLDRTMHGGTDPYILLMHVLGTPYATTFINAAYHFWFFLFYFIVFIASFDRNNPIRGNTMLLSFVLVWAIGGNLLAIVFSSAGPVYYEYFGHGDDFVPLLNTLKEFSETSPVWVLKVHDLLLEGYLSGEGLKGISAMPSMHVAVAVLIAIYGFHYRRWAGWLLVGFALLIQIGSVHLAWHYSIDGYAGAVIALLCWKMANILAKRYS